MRQMPIATFMDELDLESKATPVFFGPALNNFGVRELPDASIRPAPHPTPKTTEGRPVRQDEGKFSSFIFRIHANMNPKHGDRVAFMRVCTY
ncbi:MAG: hypothetical protein NT080_06945 [Spirochaetes bacterium]|nr:hypothetical protein [Spirochaetota bacterium]